MRCFKTAPGQYGSGDVLIGHTVPEQRALAKKYQTLSLADTITLLQSKEHEFRLTALMLLTKQYSQGTQQEHNKIFDLYLDNTKWVNN